MPIRLDPVNAAAGVLHLGDFSWGWMLDRGVGLPIGCGGGDAAEFAYVPQDDPPRSDPYNGGGYRVTAPEAQAMALAAAGLVRVQQHINACWEALSAEDKDARAASGVRYLYRPAVREDFIAKTATFAAWAAASGGFVVC